MAAHHILIFAWFVAKILVANDCPPIPLTDLSAWGIKTYPEPKSSLTQRQAMGSQ